MAEDCGSVKRFAFSQQLEYLDTKDIDVFFERLCSLTQVKQCAVILHDKDLNKDGTFKAAHFQGFCTLKNTMTIKSIADTLKVPENIIEKPDTSSKTNFLYLVHRNHPHKFQYSPLEVKANFDYVSMADACPARVCKEDIAFKIENGTIKQYNLFDYITVDEYARNKPYYQRCFEYREQKSRKGSRSMECIFITGASGVGKTTLAKQYAQSQGYSIFISSGGKNPLDDYGGQDCIVLDDTRDCVWSLSDFLKLTDNNTDSLVGCRYYNKSIGECKVLILTSCKSIKDFYLNARNNDNESEIQLYRRFQLLIDMNSDTVTYYCYNDTLKTYVKQAEVANTILAQFEPKKKEKLVKSFMQSMGIQIYDKDGQQIDIDSLDLEHAPFPPITI